MKKLLLFLISIGFLQTVSAQMQGPNSPTASTEGAAGCLACPGADWTNFANVYANDNMNVITQMSPFPNCFQSSCFYSKDLEVSNFSFTIPASATINGIMVEVKKNSISGSTAFPIRDSVVRLMTSVGTLVGMNRASTAPWSGTSAYTVYGNSTDLWGTSWTPADINSAGFGMAFKARNTIASGQVANVDHVRITVYYTNTSIGTNDQQSQSSDIVLFPNPATSTISIISSSEPIEWVTLFDILGNKIIKTQCKAAIINQEVDLKDVTKGIYFVEVKTKTGTTIKKFAKQ